jgi:hypothetical protein
MPCRYVTGKAPNPLAGKTRGKQYNDSKNGMHMPTGALAEKLKKKGLFW